MSDNPYAAPHPSSSEVVGVLSGRRDDLRTVAKFQKGILVCILLYLIALFSQLLFSPDMQRILYLCALAVGIAGAVFVLLLAMKIYGIALGILLGILTLVPCIGLIVLLIVNGKATSILKQNGIRVGLLGADVSVI